MADTLSLNGESNKTYSNLILTGTQTDKPLYVENCHDLIFDNIEVDGQGIMNNTFNQQISFYNSYNITIRNSIIHDGGNLVGTAYGGGIGIDDGCHDFLVENNTVYNQAEHAMQCYSGDDDLPVYNVVFRRNTIYQDSGYFSDVRGINIGWRSYNVTVEGNYIKNMGIMLIGIDDGVYDSIIKNNVLQWDSETAGFGIVIIANGSGSGNTTRNKIYHNTLIDNSINANFRFIQFYDVNGFTNTNHEIINNIVYTKSSDFRFIEDWCPSSTPARFISDYNCFYGGGYNSFFINNNGSWAHYANLALWQSATGQDLHSIAANPLLTSNYLLTSSSPCIDAGVDVGVLKDYAGYTRDNPPDIGAYEYWQTRIRNATLKNCVIK